MLFKVIANIIGFIAVVKKIYCLSVSYAIYLTVRAIALCFICYTSKYILIPAVMYSAMAVIASSYTRGIKNKRFRPTMIGVATDPMHNTVIDGIYAQPITFPMQMMRKNKPSVVNSYDSENSVYLNVNYGEILASNKFNNKNTHKW